MTGEPRLALVTGAGRGIGRAVAAALARSGYRTVLSARDLSRAQDAADEIAAPAGMVLPRVLDVSDCASVARLAAELAQVHGRLDVLVNNAGVLYDTWQTAASADLDVVTEALEVNLLGAWRTTLAMLPLLRASDAARVVNVSSGAGSLTGMGPGTPAYGVSKAALNALTIKLAADLRRDRILVNAVCPGWVATDMGGPGGRPVEDGAASIMWAVQLPGDGPTGGFFRDGRPVPW
jgi:NAD(P)-dependent dehydrogenase (short-subunit alcohol dehydrogenase family)